MAAYVIVEVETTDPQGMAEYRTLSGPSVARHGGRFLVRGGKCETLEGGWRPERLVVIEFESVEKAKAWYTAPDYQEALQLRLRSGNSRAILIEGV